MQPISIMLTLAAFSHSSQQYLLSVAGGQPQVALAHFCLLSSLAISIYLLALKVNWLCCLTRAYFLPAFFAFPSVGFFRGIIPLVSELKTL